MCVCWIIKVLWRMIEPQIGTNLPFLESHLIWRKVRMLAESFIVLATNRKHTPRFLSGLKRSIESNPSKSLAKLSEDWGISKMTVSRVMRQDFYMRSYLRRHRDILIDRCKVIQAERSPKQIGHLKSRGGDARIFVNEKKFMTVEVANGQNSRVVAYGSFQVPSPIYG